MFDTYVSSILSWLDSFQALTFIRFMSLCSYFDSMPNVDGEKLEAFCLPLFVRVQSRQYSLFIVSVYRSTDVNMHDGTIFPPHVSKLVTVPSIHQLWAHNL